MRRCPPRNAPLCGGESIAGLRAPWLAHPLGLTRGILRPLAELDLRVADQPTEDRFGVVREDASCPISRTGGARCEWGVARRALNLLLRSARNNDYLRGAYRLQRVETFLEIALDGIVTRHHARIEA